MRKEYRNNISLVANPEFQVDSVPKISGINMDLGKTVLKRILCVDLLASQARYHSNCYKNKLMINYVRPPIGKSRHRPSSDISDYMNKITEYIENCEECQFSFPELIKVADSDDCNVKTLKKKLIEHYGIDTVKVSSKRGKETIVCFEDEDYKIQREYWVQSKLDIDQEKFKVLQNAADKIRNDIRQTIYNTDSYPPSDSLLDEIENLIPESTISN